MAFLLEGARIDYARKDFTAARVDIDRAAAMRPGYPEIMTQRAWVSARENAYESAARDVRDVLRMAPTDEDARALRPTVVDGLLYEASQHESAGRTVDALRVLALGIDLAPLDARLQGRYRALVGGDAGAGATVDDLESAAQAAPDDFATLRRLDDGLAGQGRYDRVVEVWTAYLARHPDDARAYLERAGAYHHLRQFRRRMRTSRRRARSARARAARAQNKMRPSVGDLARGFRFHSIRAHSRSVSAVCFRLMSPRACWAQRG